MGLGSATLALPTWAHAYRRARKPWQTVLILTRMGGRRTTAAGAENRNLGLVLPVSDRKSVRVTSLVSRFSLP